MSKLLGLSPMWMVAPPKGMVAGTVETPTHATAPPRPKSTSRENVGFPSHGWPQDRFGTKLPVPALPNPYVV
jgi:hypothetical protein